ncbi:ATP-binding response regulator [Marinicella rhabdoformis]|uniref:ATP-binding response regulator n=1 Tax=Marinicella rhabdoformis TaxID=2580566 RepID=UPI0012AEB466|nr:ATP-binding protein [Marinicella rhabdoformis]
MELLLFIVLVFLCFAVAWQEVRIRKEKIHNQQLIQQAKVLTSNLQKSEHSSEAKSRYLSGISHELRTPLNVIMGYAQILEQQEDNPNQIQIKLIRQNCEHLNHLIESLLEFSAMEAGKLKVQKELLNLPELIKQLSYMFQNMAEEKGLTFNVSCPDYIPEWVKTDRQRLRQILINLLSNAIKFTEQGAVNIKLEYRSQVVKFTIEDTGSGMKAEDMDKIFQPFKRLKQHQKHTAGTGLGLPISKLLAELLGGELQVSSQWQQGSQFILKLMLSPQSAPTETNEVPSPLPLTNKQLNILVVDDQKAHLDLMAAVLKTLGHKSRQELNSTAALDLLANKKFDLLLLDINMPELSGWDLAEHIRTAGHQMPIVMLSGNARDQVGSEQSHHQAYLTKPVQIDQLKQCLNQLTQSQDVTQEEQSLAESQTHPISLSKSQQATLQSMADIGHISGILKKIEEWRQQQQIGRHSFNRLKSAANSYQIQRIKDLLNHAQN